MNDVHGKFEYKGKTYRLVFNLNAMEQIQEEYGSLGAWGDTAAEGEGNIKAIKFGFAAMINEGIAIENEENGTDLPPFTLPQIGRMLSDIGIEKVAEMLHQIDRKSVV